MAVRFLHTINDNKIPEAPFGALGQWQSWGAVMQVGEDGRSVSLSINFWLESDGSIRLTSETEPSLRVIIKDDPWRPLGHPTLFKRLAQCLRDMGVPAPAP